MRATTAGRGLSSTGYRFVLAIVALSLAHHVDHVLRGVTGWPLSGGLNPFTASLLVYPVVLCGLLFSRNGRIGPVFWVILAGGGAIFILLIHFGPVAGDSVTDIPDQYDSAVAEVAALLILAALGLALVAHCVYEARLFRLGGTTSER